MELPSTESGRFQSLVGQLRSLLDAMSEAEAAEARAVLRTALALDSFDRVAYEHERFSRDEEARTDMQRVAASIVPASAGVEFVQLRNPWKWAIRKRIWDLMEAEDIAQAPRPVHHRIPNFKGADLASQRLATLSEFVIANVVKVNPDTPQKVVRQCVLAQGKTLLTPQPRLRTGLFSMLSVASIPPGAVNECSSSAGVARYGTPVDLDAQYRVDLVVVGSTAVCPRTGARVGKGEGFAELVRWLRVELMSRNSCQLEPPVLYPAHGSPAWF